MSDSNAEVNSNEYNVQISNSNGPVIGDQNHIVQHFYETTSRPQVDLKAAEESYRQRVVDAYKSLSFYGFEDSDLSLSNVLIEDVFVRLALTVEKVIQEPIPLKQPEQTKRGKPQQQERIITIQEPIDLERALSNHLLIVGEPGAGKSTLFRWLAVTFAQGHQQELGRLGLSADADRLPVLVELGHLPERYLKSEGGETPNWLQILPTYITNQLAFTNMPPQLFTQALVDGRCLLLFDGLDEIFDAQSRRRLAHSLAELAYLSPNNRVVIGSRPAGVSESKSILRSQFRLCQIERFTPEDIQRFFHFWYALDHRLTSEQQNNMANTLYERVIEKPAILQLATNPLLSTILILIWRNEGDLPKRRVELYERCCRILIEHWEASHDIANRSALVGMDWEDHLRLLMPLAYTIHSYGQRTSGTKKELIPLLSHALQTEGYVNEPVTATKEAKHFLEMFGLRSGLLQYLGNDQYSFPHLTFQEYLTARYITEQPDPKYVDLVMMHLHEAWWQEVHLLTIAHLGSGSEQSDRASKLIKTILRVYRPPAWIWRAFQNRWLRLVGRVFPQVQLTRRLAWVLARECEMAIRCEAECAPDASIPQISVYTNRQMRQIFYADDLDSTRIALEAALDQRWRLHFDGDSPWNRDAPDKEVPKDSPWYILATSIQEQETGKPDDLNTGNEAVIQALLEDLHNEDSFARVRAAMSLGDVGANNNVVVQALLEALHDTSELVREEAIRSLGKVGIGNEAVAQALLESLHNANRKLLPYVARSLLQMGVINGAVIQALLEDLHNAEGSFARGMAAAYLSYFSAENEVVVQALLEALHDAEKSVRYQAARSLVRLGMSNEVVIQTLLKALRDASLPERHQAIVSIGSMKISNTTQLLRVLVALNRSLQSWDSLERRDALKAIRQLLDGQPIPGYQWVSSRK